MLWFGAVLYMVVAAIRHPIEFKEAINSILNDLLDV